MSVRLAMFPLTTAGLGQVAAIGAKAGDVVLQVLLMQGPMSGPVDVTSYFANTISQTGNVFQTTASPLDTNGLPLQGVCIAVLDSERIDPVSPTGAAVP
jgi:hypothetical protein